ncbi:hypothetical protein BC962_1900 [Gillisia mitskevichiae]|uniref:Uncharacterized protein n=1 Tax=Gillisia mitskevichiae TaxID=270921 RepID=A0A495PUI6_9FLAO|nr:hypothetical protein BC962_1900 [Gillisia mitskevichiae]
MQFNQLLDLINNRDVASHQHLGVSMQQEDT